MALGCVDCFVGTDVRARLERVLAAEKTSGREPPLLVVDDGLPAHVREEVEDYFGTREVAVLELGQEVLGSVDSARLVAEALQGGEHPVVVATGGGSTLDACKLAVAGHDKPWLLDQVMWRRPSGFLPQSGLDEQHHRQLPLIACGTRPGAASEVSPRVALAPETGASRRLVVGAALVPTYALVNPRWYSSLDVPALLQAVCESLFRLLGPYLVTEVSTADLDERAQGAARNLLLLGEALTGGGGAPTRDFAALARTTLWTATGDHTRVWSPAMPGWWCVQNTLVVRSGQPKGALSGLWLRALAEVEAPVRLLHGRAERWQALHTALGSETLRRLGALGSRAAAHARAEDGFTVDREACAEEVHVLWRAHADILDAGPRGLLDLLDLVLP